MINRKRDGWRGQGIEGRWTRGHKEERETEGERERDREGEGELEGEIGRASCRERV